MDRFIKNMNKTIEQMDKLGVLSKKTKRDMLVTQNE